MRLYVATPLPFGVTRATPISNEDRFEYLKVGLAAKLPNPHFPMNESVSTRVSSLRRLARSLSTLITAI